MEGEFLPYEHACDLKELGFDEPCLKVGNPNGHTMWKWIEVDEEPPTVNINDVIQVHYDENWTQIPTFSQAFKWFRKKYNLEITTKIIVTKPFSTLPINKTYSFTIVKTDEVSTSHTNKSVGTVLNIPSPEELDIKCMLKLIEIAKKINIGLRI